MKVKKNLIVVIIVCVIFPFICKSQSPKYIGVNVSPILQKKSNWCWVACAEMIFRYYGHSIRQRTMVTAFYGAPVNLPAMNGLNMSKLFNSNWTEINGTPFKSDLTGVFDFMAEVQTINNNDIINELSHNRPLVIGVSGHAVVMCGVYYYPTPMGPNVVGAKVVDPWPRDPHPQVYDISGYNIVPTYMGGQLSYVCTISVSQ